METESSKEWRKLYNKDMENIWSMQCAELRNAAMLLKALENEFKRMQDIAKEKFKFFEDRIQEKNVFDEKENISMDLSSPEIFFCSNSPELSGSNNNVEIITNTSQHKLDSYCVSPKINRISKISRLKKKRHNALNNISLESHNTTPKNKFQKDIVDSTLIETTPDIDIKRNKHGKYGDKFKLKLSNKPVLQTLCRSDTHVDDNNGAKSTYCTDLAAPVSKTDDKPMKREKIKENIFLYKESPARGRARLQLEGWNCAECKNFYDNLELNSQDTKKLLNKCSKHRSKFKEQNYTPKAANVIRPLPKEGMLTEPLFIMVEVNTKSNKPEDGIINNGSIYCPTNLSETEKISVIINNNM